MSDQEILLEVRNLNKIYTGKSSWFSKPTTVCAVNDVSFYIKKKETLGLVGESGCGKTTLGRTVLRLVEPTSGEVIYNGITVNQLSREELRDMRHQMQIVFQDPFASLNPRMTVREIICEPLDVFREGTPEEREKRVLEIAAQVGLDEHALNKYPHEFSGGQRQRIVIARAIILNPGFIVCDEPVSALDVSIRGQILNLMKEMQKRHGLAYLFISHDLAVVKHMSDRIAVMYLGRIVELADKDTLFDSPAHPYTKALISAIPIPDVYSKRERIRLQGDVPSPLNLPSGCSFHPRCAYCTELCKKEAPELICYKENHYVACHRYEELVNQD